ncbi:hypothetical protein [Planctomycetes bacterium TBK1r]|uniref:Uncharacterized protein n=1 Tax=Stieleria magnilauensis TaxID=2527963 RepID=A0ABX5Y301_9BACT|nr:hypothetical protein TBK1r_76890 [Planctomycetes bacterium TBK1r]
MVHRKSFLVLWLFWVSASSAQHPLPRIITCGWNAPTVAQFARDLDKMPGELPLTGCVLTLHADSGNPDPLATAHGTDDWSQLDVRRSIEAAAGVSKESMPDNYLLLKANPGAVDWFDDDGWQTIVDHYRIAAGLARQAGLRGLLLDFEPYTDPHRQFQYSRQAAATEHDFADYQTAARRRGREMMEAIAAEFPDAEICTYFLLSYFIDDHHHRGPSPVGRSDDQWCLAGHAYGLLPALVDGWLDVLPPTITLVDGCENGYWFTSARQFQHCAEAVRTQGVQLIAVENREKYSKQVRVAFPIYLDAIHPKLAGQYTLQPTRSDRLALLKRNLNAAIAFGDGLVWLYGEHGRWWPEAGDESLWKGKDTYPHWETLLPGISQAIQSVVADATQQSALKVQPQTKPSAQPDSEPSESTAAAGDGEIGASVLDLEPVWETFKADPRGDVVLGNGQVTITAAEDASGIATFNTEPNRRYMIQVQVVQQGRGLTRLSIRWKTPDGQWRTSREDDVVAYPPDGDPFTPRTITAIVTAPPQPHRMVVICNASRQLTNDDAALFGNLLIGVVDD